MRGVPCHIKDLRVGWGAMQTVCRGEGQPVYFAPFERGDCKK